MSVLIEFVFGLFCAAIGLAAGWWLFGNRHARSDTEQNQRATQILTRLHEVATRVAADVGEHSNRVEEISEQLDAAEAGPDAVVAAVTKLLEVNEHMQLQLVSADEKLQEQARAIESHATEARTDTLTALPNRRALDDELIRCTSGGEGFSLVMFDIDDFKKCNDANGHQAGDRVLRGVAQTLRESLGGRGMVARYGGEEFVVVLAGESLEKALELAEQTRLDVQESRHLFQGSTLRVTVSAGIAEMSAGDDSQTVLARADAALYAAKSSGRNRVYYHDGRAVRALAAAPPSAGRVSGPAGTATTKGSSGTKKPSATAATADEAAQFQAALTRRIDEWKRSGACPTVLFAAVDERRDPPAGRSEQVAKTIIDTTVNFLRAAVREMDLVCRYDDMEFAMLLPTAGLSDAASIAERLRQAVNQCSLPVEGRYIRLSMSVGGAQSMTGDNASSLIGRAKEALRDALAKGGNCSIFHDGRVLLTAEMLFQGGPAPTDPR